MVFSEQVPHMLPYVDGKRAIYAIFYMLKLDYMLSWIFGHCPGNPATVVK